MWCSLKNWTVEELRSKLTLVSDLIWGTISPPEHLLLHPLGQIGHPCTAGQSCVVIWALDLESAFIFFFLPAMQSCIQLVAVIVLNCNQWIQALNSKGIHYKGLDSSQNWWASWKTRLEAVSSGAKLTCVYRSISPATTMQSMEECLPSQWGYVWARNLTLHHLGHYCPWCCHQE